MTNSPGRKSRTIQKTADALSDAKLNTVRQKVESEEGADWSKEYGDASWDAAMALLGLAPMTPPGKTTG